MSDEVEFEEGLSNCCGAPVYAEIGICSDCKEPAEIAVEEDV